MDLTCDEEMLSESASPGGQRDRQNLFSQSQVLRPDLVHYASAKGDPNLVNDPRVLQNMLRSEETNLPSPNYFKMIQTDITPDMRGSVSTWMFEVCEEEHVPESVFLRAITYVDRFLSIHKIHRTHFQLLGAACLLLSSKWSGSLLSTERLVFYTAHSVTASMILEWEMMILNQFKWDMFTITPSDFIEPILHKLPPHLCDSQIVREKIKTYTAYCATDYKFCIHPPSIIASACIAAAVGTHISPEAFDDILHRLHQLTTIETDVLKSCVEQLHVRIEEMLRENSKVPGPHPGLEENIADDDTMSSGVSKLGELEQAETPTDVRDVHF